MQFNINKVKIFVTVPSKNIDDVRGAVCEAGAGIIGNYNYCTYSSKGIGTFIPNAEANPHIGERGKLEFVKEVKLEFVCDIKSVKNVLGALRKSHPYEEPAIDIVPLIYEEDFN